MRGCIRLYAVILLVLFSGSVYSKDDVLGARGPSRTFTRTVFGSPPISEINALKQFYIATGGKHWYSNKGWDSTDDACSWFGIVCNATNSVSEIRLSRNNLVGTLPNALSSLPGLRVLDVSFNTLSGPIPRGVFSLLPMFRELNLNNNQFTGNLSFFEDLPAAMDVIYIPENQFTGELPATIGKFTKAVMFQIFSNELSGTVPTEIGQMVSLESLDLGFNSFNGALPDSIGNMVNLKFFWFYDDQFTGPLPSSWSNLVNLEILEATRNQLSGDLPDEWKHMRSLKILRLGANNFSGTPNAMCSMLNLTDSILYSNQFTGIPNCSENAYLTMLLMSDNLLVGDVPDSIGSLSSLKRIDLSHNRITGTVPKTFSNLGELILLDFSHNQIHATLEDMMLPLTRIERVTSVDLSHNFLYGGIPYSMVWNDDTQEELSKSVTYLYLNNNNLTGEIPFYLSWMYRLQYADLSYNNFTGAISESLSFLSTLYVEGNPYMFGTNGGQLPSFLVPNYNSLTKSVRGDFVCPGLKGVSEEYVINVDPSYYNYSFCRCEPTYWGLNGSCTACPDHATCPGDGVRIIVEPGYYPFPNEFTPEYVMRCSKDNFGFTPCNPDSVYPFTCKKGYEGRLCSKCEPNYFSRGIECLECLSKGKQAAVIAFIVLVVASIYSFFLLTKPIVSLPSAARKTGMFYFQALNLLLTRFAGWPVVFSFLSTISSVFNFGFNYTCVIFDYFSVYYVTLAIPLYSVVLNALVLGAMYVFRYAVDRPQNMDRWINGAIRTILLTLNFMYLPLCTLVLSMFVCIEDGHTNDRFLAVAPWIQCNNSPSYNAAVSVAAICFVVYVLGIPALFTYLLYHFRDRLDDHNLIASIGCLYVDYTERTHFFELANLFRRFLFALVIAVVKQDNLFLMSTILFLVLVVYAVITIRFSPFNYRLGNIVEILAIGVLTFNLVGILAATSTTVTTATAASHLANATLGDSEAIVMQVIVLLANLAYILALLAALFFGVSHMLIPDRWKNHFESVSSIAFLSKVQTRAFELPNKRSSRAPPTIVIHSMTPEEDRKSDSSSPSSASSTSPSYTPPSSGKTITISSDEPSHTHAVLEDVNPKDGDAGYDLDEYSNKN